MLINLIRSKALRRITLTTLLLLTSPQQAYPRHCRIINPIVILNGEKYKRLECSTTRNTKIEFINSNSKNFKERDNEKETIEKVVETAEIAEIIESQPRLKIGSREISLEELNSLAVSLQSKVIELSTKVPSLISTLMNLPNQGLSSLTNQNSQKRTYLDEANELFQEIKTKTQENLLVAKKYNERLLKKELSYEDAKIYFSNLLYLMLHTGPDLQFFKEAFIHEINQVFWEGLNLPIDFILPNPNGNPLTNYQKELKRRGEEVETFLKKHKRKLKFGYYEQVEPSQSSIPLRIFIEGICNDNIETVLMSFSPEYLKYINTNSKTQFYTEENLREHFRKNYRITSQACKKITKSKLQVHKNIEARTWYFEMRNPLLTTFPQKTFLIIHQEANKPYEILEFYDNPSDEYDLWYNFWENFTKDKKRIYHQ